MCPPIDYAPLPAPARRSRGNARFGAFPQVVRNARFPQFLNVQGCNGPFWRRPSAYAVTARHWALGGWVIENGILGWLAIGLVAGVFGKLIMPGRDPGGIVVTIVIGIAGALLAGFVAQSLNWEIGNGWRNYGAATAGAGALLALYRLVVTRRSR